MNGTKKITGLLAKFFAVAKTDCSHYGGSCRGKLDYCWRIGQPCLLRNDRFCGFFDKSVITYRPFKTQGLWQAWRELWAGTPDRIVNRVCTCGTEFLVVSPRQRFCERCRKLNRTQKARERKRRERAKNAVGF
jgi:hypothetical protein